MTENLAPAPGTAHSTSDLPNLPQISPAPNCCEQWREGGRRWQLCLLVFLFNFAFPAFNYNTAKPPNRTFF